MVCDQCGTDNPEVNRFCGACGAALFRRPELWRPPSERQRPVEPDNTDASFSTTVLPPELAPKAVQKPVIQETTLPSLSTDFKQQSSEPVAVAESEQYIPISGPSLLGLSGAPEYEESDDSTYLVGEETPRRRVGWFIFGTVAVAVLIGFVVLEYKTIKTGTVKIPWLTSEASKSAEREQAAENISTPVESQTATPQPLTSNEAPAPASPPPPAQNSPHAAASPPPTDASKAGGSQQPTMEITQKKLPEPPVSTPEQPAESTSDQVSTQAATARGAEQAASKRKQEMAAAINKDEEPTPDADSASAPKAVSAPTRAPQTASDPRQNRLLLAGERFLYGRGGRRDCNQAVTYFREAAKEYNGPAMTHLGAMYASGNCVQQNRIEAYKWFSRAQEAQPNNQWLGRNMNMLWRQMTTQERASVSR